MVIAIDNPIALHKENRPPTQSQNSNMFFFSIPNLTTSFSFVLSATKCFAICDSFFACSRNQSLAVYALVIVSWVVKDFEAMRKRVLSGFTFFNVSVIWLASIFETK